MALSKLSGDEHGIILGQLCNALEPRCAVYFSSASSGLRVLLTPALLQQLKADHKAAAVLCGKTRTSFKELREAKFASWRNEGLFAANLATLGKLSSVLPALLVVIICDFSGAAGPDGVQRLAEGLGAGALSAVRVLTFAGMHVGDAGASALGTALGRGALPRLKNLTLVNAAIGDAALVALAPALRARLALVQLDLRGNPFGDEGISALVSPLPPAGALPPTTGGLKELKELYLDSTQVTDAGCTALASALDTGALPVLEVLKLNDIPASVAARAAVYGRRVWSS